ncbi:LacI family DNA-binding transcriptional regulator [Mucilaginibacter sabulilitoris]|uniref:LacI family DNA-binding transcriptional regulator n=1 Tax=Mucilaginibacter sabulilitoris TaxID=1173583 RepID=A0ABZ0TQZ0_9SPHI|nr:LacI family DNA-binding transcriptional regulator [Mucilaginibacter sabulilitoris]WPU95537.1 LacI family DNA-binding transcriptional regulator [Mucilaginibacter sabulilitoris]
MKSHQTTIIDIAHELKISKSTVSRALIGHPNVKHTTRMAVLELAEKMDYQRNMHAISLITRKSSTLGVIVPEFTSSYFPEIIIGAQTAATAAGYNIIISQSNESYETEVANTRVMLANQVDGIMISMTKETRNYDHFKVFQRKGIPIVFFNRVCDEMKVPKVVVDDYDGAFKVVEHLLSIGKNKIAHLAGPDSLSMSVKRLSGYLDALKKHQVAINEQWIIPYDLSIPKVSIYVNHLLNLENPPNAIFAINDPTAIEAIQVIKKAGLRIPQDIAVAGFSNDYISSLIEPSLTTMSQPVQKIGIKAIELLIDQIKRDVKDWKAVTHVLKTELIIRNSTLIS